MTHLGDVLYAPQNFIPTRDSLIAILREVTFTKICVIYMGII